MAHRRTIPQGNGVKRRKIVRELGGATLDDELRVVVELVRIEDLELVSRMPHQLRRLHLLRLHHRAPSRPRAQYLVPPKQSLNPENCAQC